VWCVPALNFSKLYNIPKTMISGRLHTIDEYLGLNQKKTGPESNSSSNQMLLSASSDKEFTKYVHGLDLLAHELYHPKKLLLSVKKEYMEWIQQATMELKSKTEEKEVRKKTVEQFNKLAEADSLHNMNAFVAPSAPSAPSTSISATNSRHPSHLVNQNFVSRHHKLSRESSNNHNSYNNRSTSFSFSSSSSNDSAFTRPPKHRPKGGVQGPPASLTQRRLGKWKKTTPTTIESTNIGDTATTLSPPVTAQKSNLNDRFQNIAFEDSISELPLEDYVWETMSVMPSRADANSVALKDEYKFSEEHNAWRRIVFPSKRPTDKRNAIELEKWLSKKLDLVEQTIASSMPLDSDNKKKHHWVPSVEKQMSTELPVLSKAVKELNRQLRACHTLKQKSISHRPTWSMAKTSSDDHIFVLKSLWRSTVVLMGDIVEWAKIQQRENELEYVGVTEVINSVKRAKEESVVRLERIKRKYQQTCGKTDVMKKNEQKRLQQREDLLREYLKVGTEVSALQQHVQDLLRDEYVNKKLNMGKIHMFLSTIQMMLDQMNECIDNEPSHIFMFKNDKTGDSDNGEVVDGDLEKDGLIISENYDNDDNGSHSNKENDQEEDDDDGEEEEEEEEEFSDTEEEEQEFAELNKPVIVVGGDDLQRLAALQVKITELRHLIARLTSNKCFKRHAQRGTQTEDMMLNFTEPPETVDGTGTTAELPPVVLAHSVFKQLYALWGSHGVKPMHIFGKLDDDGSGYVDQKEFRVGLSRHYKIDLTHLQVNAVFSVLDRDGSGTIEHKEFSRAVKKAGKNISAKEFNPGLENVNESKENVPSYQIPPCFKYLLNAVPKNYSPMAVNLNVAHRLIWKMYGFATQRLNSRDGVRLPEIIMDYFVLTFHEPHAAQVRIIDFLTALYKHDNDTNPLKQQLNEDVVEKVATKTVGKIAKGKRKSLPNSTIKSADTEFSIRIEMFLRLLDKCNEAAKEAEDEAAKRDSSENYEIRAKGTEDFKQFVSVLCQLSKHAGSIHSFVENQNTGLHHVGSDIARRFLHELPSYKIVSDETRDFVNKGVDELSQWMVHSGDVEQIEMIDVDNVLRFAMSLWYDERKRAKELLENMFIRGDIDGDGYLTLEEFRNMVQKVDPKRSGVEVTRMYRDAMILTNKGSADGSDVGTGGITPDAFAIVGISHGLLVQPIQRVETVQEEQEKLQEQNKDKTEHEDHSGPTTTPSLSQEESDKLVFSALASSFQEQRQKLLRAVIGDEVKRALFDKFERQIKAARDVGECLATFGELEMLLEDEQ
jgi:Ca2+-binding EF-hand superfamily protein